MDAIEVPVMLDRLDDDTAAFVGAELTTVERQTVFGSAEFTGRFPTLWLNREAWENMGTPTVLMLKLSEVTVDDRPSL